jgi:DnaK suppressor protein
MVRKPALSRRTSQLIERRDALRKTLSGDLDGFRKVSEVRGVSDHVDAAVNSANDEICSQLVEIESRELGQIEHALQRIAAGLYGRCEFCGRAISATRLSALPYANSCIECQRAYEARGHSRALEPAAESWVKVFDGPIDQGETNARIDIGDFKIDFSESGRQPPDTLLV